jgi:hypothetical protein
LDEAGFLRRSVTRDSSNALSRKNQFDSATRSISSRVNRTAAVLELSGCTKRLAPNAVPALVRLLVEGIGMALEIRSMMARTPMAWCGVVVRTNRS